MQVAVYGGSFNPPHVAHAMVAAWLRWTGKVDRVCFVPVYRHAFEGRHDKTLAPYPQRCGWCRAMAADLGEGFAVSEIEAELPVPSFTVDTLTALAARHPDRRFRLVVGADVLPQTDHWKDWAHLRANFDPIVVGRVGFPLPEGQDIAFPGLSSTLLRDRLRGGESVQHLVTGRVAALLAAPGGNPWRA